MGSLSRPPVTLFSGTLIVGSRQNVGNRKQGSRR